LSDVPIKEPVLLGKIAATHGLKGQLRVAVYSGEFETILSLASLILKAPDGGLKTFELSSAAVQGKKLIIGFKGYDDINQALPLVGNEIYAAREQMPELAEGEYYWCDLLGLRVETDKGEFLGELTDIIATGSNDVYVVKTGGREYLIPALEDIVLDVNIVAGTMKVSPPEGLLDL
jgi:16S rRNA processing protein RimM